MIKISSIGDWGITSPGVTLAKFTGGRLHASDAGRLAKIASESFAHRARNLQIEPGLEPIYDTALASTESHGFNRNGDGYTANMLTKRANTFVSHGRLYRHHKAKDPLKSYGIIKMAEYDPRMGIVHVIGALFKDAEAARRHGGGNPADEELELLAKQGSYPTSQGSSIIGGDKCVICGKVSLKREDYCIPKSAGGTCDLFGCRDGLSQIAEDGRHQALDNPDGIFHDLSRVSFGADRQSFAHSLAPGDLQKQASGIPVPGIFGAAWMADVAKAESPLFATRILSKTAERMFDQAQAFAREEALIQEKIASDETYRDLNAGLLQTDHVSALSQAAASDQPSRSLSAADLSARLGTCVSPMAFYKSAGLCDADVAEAVAASSDLFTKLVRTPDKLTKIAEDAARDVRYHPINAPAGLELQAISFDAEAVKRRALCKLAEGREARHLATQERTLSTAASAAFDKYATYKLRVLSQLMVSRPESVSFALRQARTF